MAKSEEQMNNEMLSALNKLTDALVDSSRMTGASNAGGGGGGGGGGTGAVTSRNRRLMEDQLRMNYEGLRNWGKSQDSINKLMPKLISITLKNLSEDEKKLAANQKQVQLVEHYNEILRKSAGHLEDLSTEVDKLIGKGYYEQQQALTILNKRTKGFTSALAQNQRTASLFNAALISSQKIVSEGTFEYEKFMEDLSKASKNLNEGMLKRAGVYDEETKNLREDLTHNDFSRLSQMMGVAQTSITESLAGLKDIGINNFDDLTKASDDNKKGKTLHANVPQDQLTAEQLNGKQLDLTEARTRINAALTKIAQDLIIQGHDLGGKFTEVAAQIGETGQITADQLSTIRNEVNAGGPALIANFKKINDQLDASMTAISAEAEARNNIVGMMKKRMNAENALVFAKDKLVAALSAVSIGAAVSNLTTKLKDAYQQIVDFNIAEVPASFWQVQKASVAMGLSMKDTVEFMQRNKRLMALYGDGFSDETSKMKSVFAGFGYNMAQAAGLVAPSVEAAIASGVNVKDGQALNKFISQTMNSFKDISGVVDTTAAEFIKMNADLMSSSDIANTMIGLDRTHAQAYQQEIMQLQKHYLLMGLSNQQTQELIQAQKAQQREKVTSKIKDAAKGMMMIQQSGGSAADAQRYFQLSLNGNRSDEEEKEFFELSKKKVKLREEQRNAAYARDNNAGLVTDVFQGSMASEGASAEIDKKAEAAVRADKANLGVDAKTAKKQRDKALGDDLVTTTSNMVNMFNSLLNIPLVATSLAAAGALGALTFNAMSLGKVLGAKNFGEFFKLFGKEGLNGLKSLLGVGAVSTGGVVASTAGTVAAGAAGAGAVGAGAAGAEAAAASKAAKISKYGKLGGKAFGLAGVAYGAYETYQDYEDVSRKEATGEITKQEASTKKGGAVGKGLGAGLGGWGGMVAGAKLGAMAGTFFGPVGTAIGGALGGLAGAAFGAWMGGKGGETIGEAAGTAVAGSDVAKDIESPAQPAQQKPPTVESNQAQPTGKDDKKTNVNKETDTSKSESDSGILNVADKTSQEQLLAIAQSMTTMVDLLKTISSDGLKASVELPAQQYSSGQRRLPSAYEYQTGRKTT